MTGNCFHTGCKSGNNGSKCHLFKLTAKSSSEIKSAWLSNIPKRRGKEWDFNKSRLCHLHFEDKYVIKVSVVKMNDVIIASEPRNNWTLTSDAIPTLFSNELVPKYFDRSSRKRKSPLIRKEIIKKKPLSITTSKHLITKPQCFQVIVDNSVLINLPNKYWSLNVDVVKKIITVMELGELSKDSSYFPINKWLQVH
jgi:hypothetical protein